MTWPDVVIGLFVLFGMFKGFKRGLVNELTGLVALGFGLAAAFSYRGLWDEWFVRTVHIAPGAAHVVGMLAYAAVAYAVVLVLGGALSAVAKLPLINIANTLLGAIVGFAKSAAFAWVILYLALFFPLPAPIRHDLRNSTLAQLLERPNAEVDAKVKASIPEPVRSFGNDLFAQHRS